MSKIAVIGDGNWTLAFKSVGFHACITDQPEQAIHKLANEGYSLIFIEETLAEKARDLINEYKTQTFPIITTIPGPQGSSGLGLEDIKKNVIKVYGKDILFGKED